MRIAIPFPHKSLWPNGRPHWSEKAREGKKLKEYAWALALGQRDSVSLGDGKIPVRLTVYPMPRGPAPDEDNCSAAVKFALDGIAQAIGVNDRHFAAPAVIIAPQRDSRIVIEVGHE